MRLPSLALPLSVSALLFSCVLFLALLLSLSATPAHAVKADDAAEDHMKCGFFAIGKVGNEYKMLEMSTDVMRPLPKNAPLAKVAAKHIKGDGQIFLLIKYLKVNDRMQIESYDIINTQRFLILGGVIGYTRFGRTMTLDGHTLNLTEEARDNLDKECYTNAPLRQRGHAVVSKTNPGLAIMAKFVE